VTDGDRPYNIYFINGITVLSLAVLLMGMNPLWPVGAKSHLIFVDSSLFLLSRATNE